jgi:cell division protein FtsN
MNDHNLDDLIIDTIEPQNNKVKNFLTLVALLIVIAIVGIILAKSYNTQQDNSLVFDDNTTVTIEPELKLQTPKKESIQISAPEPKPETSLSDILEKKDDLPKTSQKSLSTKTVSDSSSDEETNTDQEIVSNTNVKNIELPPQTIQETKNKIAQTEHIETPKNKVKTHIQKTQTLPTKKYYVQVGSFKHNPSPRFLSIIKSSGFNYIISQENASGDKKLLIGPYKTRKDVDKALVVVRDRIHKSAFVVQK